MRDGNCKAPKSSIKNFYSWRLAPAADMERLNHLGLPDRLAEPIVKLLVGKNVIDIGDDEAIIIDLRASATKRIHAEQIVIAIGVKLVNR